VGGGPARARGWTRPADAAGGGDDRPGSAAAQQPLVSGHQSAPASRRVCAPDSAHSPPRPAADRAEGVRWDGLRQWVEQSDQQVKPEGGWADFPVRADRAIRRHWSVVCCAFAFCWWAEIHPGAPDAKIPGGAAAVCPALAPGISPLWPAQGAGGKWRPGA
jgi:hypothetical protein